VRLYFKMTNKQVCTVTNEIEYGTLLDSFIYFLFVIFLLLYCHIILICFILFCANMSNSING